MPPISKPGISWALNLIRSTLPRGAGWFSDEAVKTGEIGKLARAIASITGPMVDDVKRSHSGFFLTEAQDGPLDVWGEDLAVARKSGEGTEAYRQRIFNELFRERSIRRGVNRIFSDHLNLEAETTAPWTQEMVYDGDLAYGDDSYYSSEYYHGGVVQIALSDFDARIRDVADESLAIGVKPYFKFWIGDLEALPDPRPERDLDPILQLQFRQELLYGEEFEAYDGEDLYGGPERLGNTLEQRVFENADYWRASDEGFWTTSYTWGDLAELSWEDFGIRKTRMQPSAEILQGQGYYRLGQYTYQYLGSFTYEEVANGGEFT